MVLYQIQKCPDQFVILHGQHTFNILLCIREDLLTHPLHCSTVGNRVRTVQRDRLACRQSRRHTRRLSRLHTDDLDLGIQHLRKRGNTRDQSTAAYRNQDIIHSGVFLYDLHGNTSLSRRDVFIVKRMNEGVPILFCQLPCILTGIVIDVSVQDNLRAVILRAVHLDQRSHRRHDDHHFAAELLSRIGDSLCMVACRSRDQTFLPRLIAHRTDLIISAAHLVGACLLHILRLQVDPSASLLA